MVLLFGFWVTAFCQDHADCYLKATGQLNSGVNPSDAEIGVAMKSLASTYKVPLEIIAAIAHQESSVAHFASDGYLVHNHGECASVYNGASGPNPPGLGMMQLTGSTARAFDVARLRTDWKYNLECGVKVLVDKWTIYRANCPGWMRTILDGNRNVLENWYMTAWYYNGYLANYGTYAEKIFSHIQNRPGRLANLIAAGLAPTHPSTAIPHFWNSAYGETYVAQSDTTWKCEHRYTYHAPVIVVTF